MFDIKENLKNLPAKPGVYIHKDKFGEVIYVGKASSLRNRVRQYFQSSRNMDPKVRAMVSHIAEFEYIVTDTETEALILENTLIKKHAPKYNVLLRDDKTYPYIKITLAEDYPRLVKTRIVANDGSKYFGPYADVKSANQIIDLLNDIFRLKRCAPTSFPEGHRECLHFHINRCGGVCTGKVDHGEYMKSINTIIGFLNGKSKDVIDYLKSKMEKAADKMQFEEAAEYRDYINAAEAVTQKQRVDLLSSGDIDIVLVHQGEKEAYVVLSFVRDGRLVGKEDQHLDMSFEESPQEIVSAFIKQYYANSMIPREILVEKEFSDIGIVEEWLSETKGSKVKIISPQRGEKRALLKQARRDMENKAVLLNQRAKNEDEKNRQISKAFGEIFGKRGTSKDKIYRIEAYDISNTGGVDSVGAMVVFIGTKPFKRDYRKFKIRTIDGADDYGSIQEVLYRRLKRASDESPGFEKLPDIILIDGGRGHVRAANLVLSGFESNIIVAGMVKDDKHRTRGLVYNEQEYDLKKYPDLYHLIGNIQEEVHRFAIDYHRNVRGKKSIKSELDEIPGVGEKRRNALLLHFGGIEGVKKASKDELLEVPIIDDKTATTICEYFSN